MSIGAAPRIATSMVYGISSWIMPLPSLVTGWRVSSCFLAVATMVSFGCLLLISFGVSVSTKHPEASKPYQTKPHQIWPYLTSPHLAMPRQTEPDRACSYPTRPNLAASHLALARPTTPEPASPHQARPNPASP